MTEEAPRRYKAFPIGMVTSCSTLLIIGSGEEAPFRLRDARKYDWLHIVLISPELTDAVRAEADQDERLTWHAREATEDDVARAHVVVEDTDDDAKAAEIAAWCRRHGKPLNAVDKNGFCDLYYMSLIYRGPLVLSISSGGDAPALSVALRKHLEANISEGWGYAADRMAALRRSLPSGQARKTLLKSMVRDSDFLEAVIANNREEIDRHFDEAV
jgi:siroheme synthase-like protein